MRCPLALALLALLLQIAGGIERGEKVKLPEPNTTGTVSVEQAMAQRRSNRNFAAAPLTLDQVGQLLWAAQGVTSDRGGRTAPSAGATYPLECYLVAGKVESLDPGIYHYLPAEHSIEVMATGDVRAALCEAALDQPAIQSAPLSIVIAANVSRTAKRYGDRARRYVYIEVGHVGENISLECEALGLATVCIGAFDDERVRKTLSSREEPVYIMPVGYRK